MQLFGNATLCVCVCMHVYVLEAEDYNELLYLAHEEGWEVKELKKKQHFIFLCHGQILLLETTLQL